MTLSTPGPVWWIGEDHQETGDVYRVTESFWVEEIIETIESNHYLAARSGTKVTFWPCLI